MNVPDKSIAKPRGRKPKPDAANRGKRVRFIFELDRSTPNGVTFYWLIHEAYNGKEKAAIATRSFWLPFAYRDSGSYSDEELREFAQQSIWQMEEQIQHLRESFGLDSPIHSAVHSAHRQTTNAWSIPQEAVAPASASNRNAASKIDSIEGEFSSSTRLAEADILDDFADAL